MEEPSYNCNECKDKGGNFGKKTDDDTGKVYEIWIECGCSKQHKIKRLLKSSEITEAFKQMGFGNFITEGKDKIISEVRDCALAYFKDYESIKDTRTNGIALLGQPGAGKTHLLTAVANNLIQKKLIPVLYFPYVEGFNDLRDDLSKLEEKLHRMKHVEVLYIDDLFKPTGGKPQASDWEVKQLYSVINFRYLNHKPIMISSELDADKMLTIDEALGTRIVEMCEKHMVVIKGDKKALNHRLRNF